MTMATSIEPKEPASTGAKRIVIAGGTGQVGRMIARAFRANGHNVTILSRGRGVNTVNWDGQSLGPWVDELEDAEVLVNLAGHTVNCRYTRANRDRILRSRVASTRILADALRRCTQRPRVWLQASTATIYSHRFDGLNDEDTGMIGGNESAAPANWRFSIDVATAWERTLDESDLPHIRRIKLRSAMVMSPDKGGIFDVLLGLVRRGLGGWAGDGRQFVSWVHHSDFIRALFWLMHHNEIDGVVNIASPSPLPNSEFMHALGQAWGIRFGLPASRWMLEVGAFLFRTETELILKSRRVIPGRLLQNGFVFRHPTWSEAARDLCRQWRLARAAPRLSFFGNRFLYQQK